MGRFALASFATVCTLAFSRYEVSLWAFRNLDWSVGNGPLISYRPDGVRLLMQSPYLYSQS